MDTPALTELEQRLAAPGGEDLRDELQARLAGLEERLRSQLAASVPRADYALTAACADAARAAYETVRNWPAQD